MNRLVLSLLLTLVQLGVLAQTGTWKAYMAYYEPQQIVKGGDRLYVKASDNLYSYNLNDQSITTYDKIRQLNDTKVGMIAWNPTVKKLIIIYGNYNIDLLNEKDETFNIISYYNKTTTLDKTVNAIYIYQQYAYLATGFGIVKIDMQRQEIAESYILKQNILDVEITGNEIYARHASAYLKANLSTNLIDPDNWEATDSCPAGLFVRTNSDWNNYIETVKTLKPDGPRYNYFGAMHFKNNRLYTVGGGYNCVADLLLPGMIQILKDDEWIFLGDSVEIKTGHWFQDLIDVAIDPHDPTHLFAGSRGGLYEFRNNAFVQEYTYENSPLSSALGNDHSAAKNYTIIEGLTYDNEGNLWVLNSIAKHPMLKMNQSGEWETYDKDELYNNGKSLNGLQCMLQDSRGYLWFINYHWVIPSIYCYNPETDTFVNKYVNTLYNQDNVSYEFSPLYLQEDHEHNIWICTNKGLFMVDDEMIKNGEDNHVMEIKVPRNDGTNYADYLMNGNVITAMVVDGGGRKWIGTQTNGLYLISEDNMTEIHHFTTSNSDILDNSIRTLEINNETGELFIGTEAGLCSYMTDATEPSNSLEKDEVYAYPNPVPANYNGQIVVRGLTYDADVKILSVDGRLINQGRSNGGTFTWNGCDLSGHKVASGVYMIAVATSEGKKGIVCKVAVIR